MSNANELTYSLNCEDAAGQCSARKSKVFALARNSARSFSAETVRAAFRHFSARRRYSSGLFVFLYVIELVLVIGVCCPFYVPYLANQLVRQAPTNVAQRL
jgi:hypothetical protein